MGSRAETSWPVVVPAEEWDPYAHQVDLGERYWPEPVEVSLTPDAVFSGAWGSPTWTDLTKLLPGNFLALPPILVQAGARREGV